MTAADVEAVGVCWDEDSRGRATERNPGWALKAKEPHHVRVCVCVVSVSLCGQNP